MQLNENPEILAFLEELPEEEDDTPEIPPPEISQEDRAIVSEIFP